ENLPGSVSGNDFALYSESQGRLLVTICPENEDAFEEKLKDIPFAQVGTVTSDNRITIQGLTGGSVITTTLEAALQSYRSAFRDY
ncbi:hypothetical protein KAU04_04305, partial [bacterium]|nr:hypothetical protein [bacterium]